MLPTQLTNEIRDSLSAELTREQICPDGICLNAFRGSIADGTFCGDLSDVDLMGVVIGGPEHYLGLHQWGSRGTRKIKQGRFDIVFYELRKMFSLLLQGNPNVMSLLWLRPEDYFQTNEAGRRIIANRHLFVGKHVHASFAGYASGQLQKMESRDPVELRDYLALTYEAKYRGIHPNQKRGDNEPYPDSCDQVSGETINARAHSNEVLLGRLRHYMKRGDNTGTLGDKRKQLVLESGFDIKNAAHCIRLLRMAREFLLTGEMIVFRPDAAELLDIKRGKWSLAEIKSHAKDLFAQVKSARDRSTLPDGPNEIEVERLLIGILRKELWG